MPRNNQEFWMNKLQGNKDRDKFVTRELRKMGSCPRVGTRVEKARESRSEVEEIFE
jgi:G:T-mismatch repair DNA endonuclease (very short patch repair protein)